MATREATIRVTLRSGGFQSEMRRMEGDVKGSGRRMGSSLRASLSGGLAGAKKSIGDLAGGLKNMIRMAGTLGGALAVGKLVTDATKLQTKYRSIAYNISKIPGQAMEWTDVQGLIDDAVAKTGQSADGLADAFADVFESTGDLELATSTIEAIGTIATATGQDVGLIGNMAQMAARKFDVPVSEMTQLMSEFESMVGVGGGSLDKLGPKFGMLAGEASSAGLTGSEGMKTLMNMLIMVDNKIGEKAEPALKRMFEVLHEGGVEIKAIQKEMGRGFEFKSADVLGKMKEVLAAGGKGKARLLEYLTGPSKIAFEEITSVFETTMAEAIALGKPKAEATELALAAFDQAITGAGRELRSYEDNVAQAKKNMAEDPGLKLRQAINKIQQAFAQPKMIDAISKLADKLPALAEGIADLIEFVVDNPLLSVGIGVGAKVGAGFLGGAIQAGAQQLFAPGGPFSRMIGSVTSRLGGLAKSAFNAQNPVNQMSGKAMAAVGGLAAAAAAGYALGKALESAIKDEEENLKKGEKSRAAANDLIYGNKKLGIQAPKTAEEHAAVATKIKKMRAAVEREQKHAVDVKKTYLEGPVAQAKALFGGKIGMGDLINLTREAIMQDKDFAKETILGRDIKTLEKLEAKERRLAEAADKASEALENVGKNKGGGGAGAGSARGTKQLGSNPGAEPTAG